MDEQELEQEVQQPDLPEKRKKKRGKKDKFGNGFVTGFVVAVIFCLVVTMLFARIRPTRSGDGILDRDTQEKVESLASYIQSTYYEEVDVEDIKDGLYQGLFDNLDIYSRYYTAEEYKELYENNLSGSFEGIGAALTQDESTSQVSIVRVFEDSPAEQAGLKDGDIIVEVDHTYDPLTMDLDELITHIRGEVGTSVHLEIYREGEALEFDIIRGNVSTQTVAGEMLEDNIGYIAVSTFSESTTEQFAHALDELQEQGMEKMIVDLRANPGGVLTAVCDMLDMILPEGLLVYTEDRAGNKETYNSTDDQSLQIPIVVLVDSNSASASEIFAGAIQDRGAGTIVGTTTYGKGVVQSVRKMEDGSAFKLTTHRYFTPGGTCIQGIGITPDVEIEYEFLGTEEDYYSYDLDNQIQKAVEILKK